MAGYGMQGHVMLQMQNSFGTSLTTSLQTIAITEESITHTIEQIQEASMYSRFGQSPTHEGINSIEGDITIEAEPQGLGWLLRTFCDVTTVDGHTHTFRLASSDFDDRAATTPVTIEVYKDVGSSFLYYDMIGNTMEIAISNGELMTTTVGYMGAGFDKKTAATPIFPVDQTPFAWNQTSASYDSANLIDLKDLTISFNKNLENHYVLQNTNTPYKIKRSGQETIEINGTIIFQSHSYHQAFIDQSEKSLSVNFQSNSPNALNLFFPKVKIKTYENPISGPGVIEQSFTADALFDTTSNYAFQADLTNVRTISY